MRGSEEPPAETTVAVRVKPGSRSPRVGGSWGDPPELVVAVAQRAVDGAANRAALAGVAAAFGVPRTAVRLVRGARGRSKLVAVDGDPVQVGQRLARLLEP